MTTLVRVVAAACSVCGAEAYRETVLALELSPLVVRPKVFVKGCSVIFNIHVNLVPVDGREGIAESYALGPHSAGTPQRAIAAHPGDDLMRFGFRR
jgi:hypothetical protein